MILDVGMHKDNLLKQLNHNFDWNAQLTEVNERKISINEVTINKHVLSTTCFRQLHGATKY